MFTYYVPACNNTIDLVFLLDGSTDVTLSNFKRSLRFVSNLAKLFNVSSPNDHVALVVYAEESETIFNLTDHLSYQEVKQAISVVRYPNKMKRNVGKGLKHVKNNVLANSGRSGVPKIVISLQNRKSDDGIDIISQQMKADGTKVFGVGNGNIIADGQLKEIAFKPNEDYFKTVAYDVIDLPSFAQQMKKSICKGISDKYAHFFLFRRFASSH